MRVGFGYDVHPLASGNSLTLGGIHIPHTQTAVGHSDADVLIHAIIDALLGAAGLRDIGTQYPDSSDSYKDIDSKILLGSTLDKIREQGYTLGNIDTTVCLEKPAIGSYIPEMQAALCAVMQIRPDQLSIKAKTGEGLGFIGREEGVSAYAVALIYQAV
ncbi:MAG: 2-C-methyl-D-erythritol 2,4-cyclodiphosphate synthase [Bacteroidales bacterium]|nr:2-C-methyl-D-erythritol 2,4-cyclodiphosphate synthase [Bacteroidales bacterium]